MFWFDRSDGRGVFCDIRKEAHRLTDKSSKGGSRALIISPDIQADFTALPFAAGQFSLVVFDPPHFDDAGKKSWTALKYGILEGNWQDMIRKGFSECFRVLAPNGTLIFKWCEYQIPVSRILKLTPESPLFGNRRAKGSKTHWITFMKSESTHAAH